MTIHLLRPAVGCASIEELQAAHAARMAERRKNGEPEGPFVFTRNIPRRIEDLVNGGSLYWVIKSFVRARQRILGIERKTNAEGRSFCLIRLEPVYFRTEMRPHKPFQGWRYLRPEDAPPDVDSATADADELPPEMADELRELGLL